MCSLQTMVATQMFQQLKLFIDMLALSLHRQKGMALLERVQASSLSDEDRDRVSHILRVMLRLPDDQVPESSPPQAPLPGSPDCTAPSETSASIGELRLQPSSVSSMVSSLGLTSSSANVRAMRSLANRIVPVSKDAW